MRKRFLAYVRIITRYAGDRDRSMGVTKRALLLYVRAPYVRIYYINAHARTKTETREQNETARDRTSRRTPVKRHGTARHENFNFLLMGTVRALTTHDILLYMLDNSIVSSMQTTK